MRITRIATVALLVAGLGAPARAHVPEKTPRRALEASTHRVLSRPETAGTTAGVLVLRGDRTLVALNADRTFVPASLMKLVTTTVAVVRFEPTHRFHTRVLGGRTGGTVRQLYLVGGGDPTLATAAYRRVRFLPKPTDEVKRPAFPNGSPTVGELAARVVAAGVRRVRGDIVADDSLFDTRRTQDGWLPDYLTNDPDSGLLSALTVNEGMADLERTRIVASPALSAGAALRRALAARGVRVGGSVRLGRAPTGAKEIARVSSPPLTELVDFIDRYSINFPAEMLLKSLGARFGGRGSTAAAVRVVRETLADLKVPLNGFHMTDGSGLSVLNRVTPRAVAAVIRRIMGGTGRGWEALRAAIPVAGRPGTLFRRMRGAPTGGNLRGKTGQISDVRAMAGWVTAADGVPLVYVAIFNRARRPFELTGPLNLLGLLLALFPGP